MEALKLTIEGKSAFFKKPDVNTYLYFTYGHIHKVALLGIFGAILGYKGYNQMTKEEDFPEFYDKLSMLKIAIVPNNNKGIIDKKVNIFNNSVGYASQETGGNLIIKEQWLYNPSWDIYVLLDCEESKKLSNAIINRDYQYLPYLGKNDHIANITKVSIEDVTLVNSELGKISSFFKKESFNIPESNLFDDFEDDSEPIFKYEEKLPLTLSYETNSYILHSLIYTNNKVEIANTQNLFKINDLLIQFL